MSLKSHFNADLKKEELLTRLLDKMYSENLTHYHFERITDLNQQYSGIDVLFKHKKTTILYAIDEKAQLDYINEDLPTFAFELSYLKDETLKQGWLFDKRKKTDFYALITAIFQDNNVYSSCKITLVNREKLLQKLSQLHINEASLNAFRNATHGKITIPELHSKKEGYLYLSSKNKAEQPLNLVLKLNWLIACGIAKRLI